MSEILGRNITGEPKEDGFQTGRADGLLENSDTPEQAEGREESSYIGVSTDITPSSTVPGWEGAR